MEKNHSKYGAAWILILVLLLSIISGCEPEEKKVEQDEISVQAYEVQKGQVEKEVCYTGTLRGVKEAVITPKLPNQVLQVRVKPGDKVRKGQLLILLESQGVDGQLGMAQAGVSQAAAALDNAEKSYKRMDELFKQGAISQQQYDQAKTGYDVAKASMEQARAAVQSADTQADYARICSPIDGTVGIVYLNVGDTADTHKAAGVISDLSSMEVEIAVNENDITYLNEGREVKIMVDAASDEPFTGKVTEVSSVADLYSKSYPVKIQINNKEGRLKSGMFSRVTLGTAHKDDAVVIPAAAVVEKGVGRMVYILNADSTVKEVEVELGIIGTDKVEILKGVEAGNKIIVKGQTLLHDGDKVRVVDGGSGE